MKERNNNNINKTSTDTTSTPCSVSKETQRRKVKGELNNQTNERNSIYFSPSTINSIQLIRTSQIKFTLCVCVCLCMCKCSLCELMIRCISLDHTTEICIGRDFCGNEGKTRKYARDGEMEDQRPIN